MSIESQLCPRKILGISKNFTAEELRSQFKRKVIKLHPDMKSSDIACTEKFQILSTCYKILLKELEMKKTDKDFITLKKESGFTETQTKTNVNMNPDSFNIDKFNNLFASAKIVDPQEDGYDDWIKTNKFKKNDGELIVHKEPTAKVGSTLGGYLLGVDKINDFSGENSSDKNLNYMDYRLAYTTPIIHDEISGLDKISKRKDFKNLEDLEAARARINFQMNSNQVRDLTESKIIKDEKEKGRVINMMKRDIMIKENFNKNNGLFLSLANQK